MEKGRLEAFTDGVLAIVITIMVLEIKVPARADLAALAATAPLLAAYALSFANVGIFWNNHHHMLHLTRRINGAVLWANLALLFSLSLLPFCIQWMGAADFAPLATASYGVVLSLAAVAYWVLERTIVHADPLNEGLAQAIGGEVKGLISIGAYAAAVPLAFVRPWIAIGLYGLVAAMWFVPDRRIESRVKP